MPAFLLLPGFATSHRALESAVATPAAPAQQLPELPEAAVACILQHVPLRERLTHCALVCRAWAALAAAAPANVDVQGVYGRERCEQLQYWLNKHAGVVVTFTAEDCSRWPLQLPILKLTQLHSLDLWWLKVQQQVPWKGVTTRSRARRTQGSSLTGSAGPLFLQQGSSTTSGAVSTAAVLPQLRQLTFSCCSLTLQLLSQLLSATTLSQLCWERSQVHDDHRAAQLSSTEEWPRIWQLLQQLPLLTELQLLWCWRRIADIPPLGSLQNLQCFRLELSLYFVNHHSGARELLAALQHLKQLRHLQLQSCGLGISRYHRDNFNCYSALTASSHLTNLDLEDLSDMPVPQAAFDHMFPPGRTLPNLKVLRLEGCVSEWSELNHCVEEAQVAKIAASCPALCRLALLGVTPIVGLDARCLLQLPPGVTSVQGLVSVDGVAYQWSVLRHDVQQGEPGWPRLHG
jgi:hypothetical protein